MSVISVGAEAEPVTPVVFLRPSALLYVYIIIPIVAIFLVCDSIFSGLALSRSFPADPHSIQWFTVFFMLPHIFTSAFTFLDAEYIQHYRRRLIVSSLLFVLLIAVVMVFHFIIPFMLFVSIYTIYHLIGQQTGIASMLAGSRSRIYTVWKWVTFLTLLIIYMAVILGGGMNVLVRIFPYFCLGYLFFSLFVAFQAPRLIGRYYILATAVMIVFSFLLYVKNLPFFMILIPRFVHDVTAYFFYVTHNMNRNAEKNHSIFSRLRKKIPLPEYLYAPLVGVVCTVIVTVLMRQYIVFLIAFMALFHYHLEGVMWKNGSPHRRYIHMAPASI
jgi:hypothetical protein